MTAVLPPRTIRILGSGVTWGAPVSGVPGENERCIEIPLGLEVAAIGHPGWVLDAGCALNSVINLVPPKMQPICHLVHVTQSIGSEPFRPAGTQRSFVSADLRDLSLFADRAFDRVVCLSTLEHVGLDNRAYDAPEETCPDTWIAAFRELWRLTQSTLLITVPFCPRGLRNARWRFFDAGQLQTALRAIEPVNVAMRFYQRVDGAWSGGETQPRQADQDGFPDKVNAIVALKLTR